MFAPSIKRQIVKARTGHQHRIRTRSAQNRQANRQGENTVPAKLVNYRFKNLSCWIVRTCTERYVYVLKYVRKRARIDYEPS